MTQCAASGGCQCGAVRYTISLPPVWAGYCHCTACRKATGAAAVTHVGVAENDLRITCGSPKLFVSSKGVVRGFCGDCGTPLTYGSDRFDNYVQVYAGTLDDPDVIRPQAHVHVDEQLGWCQFDDGARALRRVCRDERTRLARIDLYAADASHTT